MKRALRKTHRGAVATGAASVGAASLGAMAMGAVAFGALAIGALAIGRLNLGRARVGRLEIGELSVGRLDVGAPALASGPMAVSRVRTMPGQGDAFERLVLDHPAESESDQLLSRVFRAGREPELFLIHTTRADGAEPPPDSWAPWLDAVFQQAVERNLVRVPAEDPPGSDLYRPIRSAEP